jgi:hypothetical protein
MMEEYQLIPAMSNYSSNVKYCSHAMNKFSVDEPIWLMPLVDCHCIPAKKFGNDAFGKGSVRCKLGASIVNVLMEKNTIFSSGGIR